MTVTTIDDLYRDFDKEGQPSSGVHHPLKEDIRDTLKKLLEGLSTFPDNRVIRLNNIHGGTANNIVVSASVAIPAAAYQVLYILNVTQQNTGPVTITGVINRTLVTNTSRPVPAGYLTPGMALLCIDTGLTLRMLSYGDMEVLIRAAQAEVDKANLARAAAEAARDIAAGYASDAVSQGSVPIYSTAEGLAELEIPEGINFIRTNGYYAANGSGAANYRKKSAIEIDRPGDQVTNGATVRWGISDGQEIYAEMFGAKADYDPTTPDAAFDNAPAFNSALAFTRNVNCGPGLFCFRGTVNVGHYGKCSGIKPIRALGINADIEPVLDHGEFSFFVFRDLPRDKAIGSMITNRKPFGGVVNNPNAGAAYTLASGSALNTYEVEDFTNKDAVGATPATRRLLSTGLIQGRVSVVENIAFRSTRHDGSLVSDPSIMDWGQSPDIMVLAENPYGSILRNCHIGGWGSRIGGLAVINHNSGDGYPVEADIFQAIDNIYEGHASILVRGADDAVVTSITGNAVRVPWWPSHQFGSSGQINVNGSVRSYTNLVYLEASQELSFEGMSSMTGLAVGQSVMRQQDYNDSAIGEMTITGFARCMTHASLKPCTDRSFTDAFDTSARVIEVGSAKSRGIRFNLTIHAREDVIAFFDNIGTVHMDGYVEVKDLQGMASAARIIAISEEQARAGMGGIPHPVGGCRDLRLQDGWNQTLSADTSPAWRPQNSIGRFGTSVGLCAPDGGSNAFYSIRSRDGTATRWKAPGTLNQKHPFQWLTSGSNVRASMDVSGRWQFGFGLDTETALTDVLHIINNGGHLVRSTNTASTAATGFHAQNSAGSTALVVDANGRGNLRTGGIGRLEFGASWLAPMTDNGLTLGTSAQRWQQIFAVNGTINTSDERLKQGIDGSPEVIAPVRDIVLDAWEDVEWVEYRMNHAVAEKGNQARVHVGLVAQRVRDVFANHGLDPFAFGLLCYDEWGDVTEPVFETVEMTIINIEKDDHGNEIEQVEVVYEEKTTGERKTLLTAGDKFSLRYDECLALEAAYQRRRIGKLETILLNQSR